MTAREQHDQENQEWLHNLPDSIEQYSFEGDYLFIQDIDMSVFGDVISEDEMKRCNGYVCRDRGEIIAYLLYTDDGTCDHIRSMAVLKSYQRWGIGTTLLTHMMERSQQPITLNIDVNWNKVALQEFYSRFEFVFSGNLAHNGNEIWIYKHENSI